MNIQIISIEGNIGSGKSTLISCLKTFYDTNVYFLEEPVNDWVEIKDTDGKNIIEKFYENQETYSFSFQMMAYISRLSVLKKAIEYCKLKNIKLIICERSLQTDKNVFCKMLHDSKKIEDVNFQIYNKWFDEFITEIPKIYYIYVKTKPDTALKRVKKRNRKGETMDLSYLKMCSEYHDKWLNSINSFIIDGNNNSNETFTYANDIISSFLNYN